MKTPDLATLQRLSAALEQHRTSGTLTYEIWADAMRGAMKADAPGYSGAKAMFPDAEPGRLNRFSRSL